MWYNILRRGVLWQVIQRFDGYCYDLEQIEIKGTFPLQPVEVGASMCR